MAYQDKDYAGGAAIAPRTSPFSALTDAIDHMRKASAAVTDLSDRIVGNAPRPVSTATKEGGIANGLIDGMERSVEVLNALAASILEDVQRIERRL